MKKKWHPGNYFYAQPPQHKANASATPNYSLITNDANMRGAVIIYFWGLLEPTKGKYDFSRVHTHLNALKASGKRLILWLNERSVNSTTPYSSIDTRFLPAYLDPNGWSPYNLGEVAKIWDNSSGGPCDREILLIQAIAAEFDNEPYFEGILLNQESAVGPNGRTADYTWAGLQTCYERQIDAAAAAFRHSNVWISLNFITGAGTRQDAVLQALTARAASKGVGIGGPDFMDPSSSIRSAEFDVFTGVRGGVDYRGMVPRMLRYADIGPMGTSWCAASAVALQPLSGMAMTHTFWGYWPTPSSAGACQQWSTTTGVVKSIAANPSKNVSTCPSSYTQGCETK